jgi:hypothetical protein
VPKPFLVQKYRTGERVTDTGIYTVIHEHHRLPHQVIIFKGESFPRCSGCSDAVYFYLEYPAPDLFESGLIRIYELPILEEA